MTYKKFDIDNSTYIFCVDDFEVVKIGQIEDVENVFQEIKSKKEISNPNKYKNESRPLKAEFLKSKKIDTIGIDLTNGCNLDCTYCFISASSKKRKVLSKEKFLDILNFLKKENNRNITFYFAGAGEPTLNFKLIEQLPKLCEENGLENYSFDLTTNGTILTQEMVDFFKQHRFEINISLDGSERINDLSRVYSNGKGSFKDVYKNINLLRENNIEFSCKTVVLPDNKNLVDVFSFFEENKITFKFTIVTNSFNDHFSPNIDDLNNFAVQMEFVIAKYRDLIEDDHKIYSDKIINDIKRIHLGDAANIACVGSRGGFYMDIEGGIYPCSYQTSSKELSVGNIYKGIDYEKIIANDWYAKPVDSYEACKDCWMKYLCCGSCFAIKWLENKNTNQPSEYLCKTYDIYWKSIIKLYIQLYPVIISGENINFLENEN
ncbi:radical SAM protein [Marinifilum sp.]|uniref:radical SAM protein n=1 Tax=Marinifilum sp. TaxID=2033137 RepID=UPI003BAB3115